MIEYIPRAISRRIDTRTLRYLWMICLHDAKEWLRAERRSEAEIARSPVVVPLTWLARRANSSGAITGDHRRMMRRLLETERPRVEEHEKHFYFRAEDGAPRIEEGYRPPEKREDREILRCAWGVTEPAQVQRVLKVVLLFGYGEGFGSAARLFPREVLEKLLMELSLGEWFALSSMDLPAVADLARRQEFGG